MKLFRDLNPEEEKTFRQWARNNYTTLDPINGLWHPTIQEECAKINREYNDAGIHKIEFHGKK